MKVNYDYQSYNEIYTFELENKEVFVFSPYVTEHNCATLIYGNDRPTFIKKLKSHITWDEPVKVESSSGQVYTGVHPQHYQSQTEAWGKGTIDQTGVDILHATHALLFAVEENNYELAEKLYAKAYTGIETSAEYDLPKMIKAETPQLYILYTPGWQRPDKEFPISLEQALLLKRENRGEEYVNGKGLGFWITGNQVPSSSEEAFKQAHDYPGYRKPLKRYPEYYKEAKTIK